MQRSERGDAELLAAYVDGVAELSLDERKRVDDLIARDPALRMDEAATRELIGQLRDLPPAGNEPDWAALERGISDAVGKDVPQSWWQRMRWRFIVPGVALAMTAAILALVLHDPEPASTVAPQPPAPIATEPALDEVFGDELTTSTPLWLDGTDLEVAIEAAELFDLEWELDEEAVPETAELLPPTDLEWVDELDGESLDRVEKFLDHPRHRRGPS
jgi:hypothetical protein